MQYPQLLPKELRTELDLYRYYRLSFLVDPEDAGQRNVTLANLTIRGFVDISLPPIGTTFKEIQEFIEGGQLLGPVNPMIRDEVGVYLQRKDGKSSYGIASLVQRITPF